MVCAVVKPVEYWETARVATTSLMMADNLHLSLAWRTRENARNCCVVCLPGYNHVNPLWIHQVAPTRTDGFW